MLKLYFYEQLQSEDIAHDMNEKDSSVIKILNVILTLCSVLVTWSTGHSWYIYVYSQDFFSTSKYSLALPYVSIPAEGPRILNTWFSTIKNSCDMKPRIVILRTCLRQMFDPRKPLITEGFQIVDSVDDLTVRHVCWWHGHCVEMLLTLILTNFCVAGLYT